jgi:hypothetical protein
MSADSKPAGNNKFLGKAAAFTAAATIACSGGAMASLRSSPHMQNSGPQLEQVVAHASEAKKGSNPFASFIKGGISATISKTGMSTDSRRLADHLWSYVLLLPVPWVRWRRWPHVR